MMTVETTVPSPVRIGVELIAVDEGAPLDLNLRLESVSEGVLVTGTVSAPTSGECARCLNPLSGDVEIDLTELFAYPESTTDETTDDDEVARVSRVRGGLVLPFSPVCGDDCAGLCPDCGVPLADAEPGHQHEKIDPRWAKLAELRDQTAGGTREPSGDEQ